MSGARRSLPKEAMIAHSQRAFCLARAFFSHNDCALAARLSGARRSLPKEATIARSLRQRRRMKELLSVTLSVASLCAQWRWSWFSSAASRSVSSVARVLSSVGSGGDSSLGSRRKQSVRSVATSSVGSGGNGSQRRWRRAREQSSNAASSKAAIRGEKKDLKTQPVLFPKEPPSDFPKRRKEGLENAASSSSQFSREQT